MRFAHRALSRLGYRVVRSPGRISFEKNFRINLDYPLIPKVRWTLGNPNQRIFNILERQIYLFRKNLDLINHHIHKLSEIPLACSEDNISPRWKNNFISPLDGMSIYWALAQNRPKHYVEIGSGNSTKFARRAISDLGLNTQIISIDPFPRAEINAICDEVIRQPLEKINLNSLHSRLIAGDVIFLDGSHRAFQNSDVTVFFNEFMWDLPPQTLIGIHDIYLPYDYPSDWLERFYSEQYVLAAALLADESRRIKVQLPCYFSHTVGLSQEILAPIWAKLPRPLSQVGGAFWLTIEQN